MALIPLHKAITKEVLQAAGFSQSAAERAAMANARVDDKQGNDAAEANLHAMLGYVPDQLGTLAPGRRLQTEQEAKQAVDALLTGQAEQAVTAVLKSEFLAALELLGAALRPRCAEGGISAGAGSHSPRRCRRAARQAPSKLARLLAPPSPVPKSALAVRRKAKTRRIWLSKLRMSAGRPVTGTKGRRPASRRAARTTGKPAYPRGPG